MLTRAIAKIDSTLTDLGFGMRGKLISLFIIIKVAPLCLVALMAWLQFEHLGDELQVRTEILADNAKTALSETGDIAVADAIRALDDLAQEDIERMTTDAANRVADFLYARDADIRFVASLKPDADLYKTFLGNKTGRLPLQGEWALSPDGDRWQPAALPPAQEQVTSSNEENRLNFKYRSPDALRYENRPLFLELTYLDLEGHEKLKVVTSDRMSPELKDVSKRENTYVRAENYFPELQKLKPGEIYVSDVIGAYVPSRIIGNYTPDNAAKAGIPYAPENEAFAGRENPLGKKFRGIVRWASPVVKNGVIVGYVTLALDHDHIMAFVDHITPSKQRYSELSDAHNGNYAFIWDYKGRSIAHPRHHSIVGYNPETGDPQVPWLEDKIYERWQESGKPYTDFIVDEETFVNQSVNKKPAPELTAQGLVGLDCRYLNFAPQCTGWFDLTSKGGSGSFNILWSGLRKLTTAATIPYFTGQYADSPRGFGFVAVGAGLEDFHRPATETGEVLESLVEKTEAQLKQDVESTRKIIVTTLTDTALHLSLSTFLMALLVVFIAVWMASSFAGRIRSIIDGMSQFRRGERDFRFRAQVKDEMGVLCDSFDSMADSIENSVQGTLAITDAQMRLIYANSTFLNVTRTSLEQIRGKLYSEVTFFSPGNDPLDCLLTGREAQVEFDPATAVYYKGVAEEHKNQFDETIGYIITTTNVTSMVETQRRTEEQRLLLDTIFSSSPDLIWYTDASSRYLAVNPRFAALFGLPSEEMLGKTASELYPSEKARAAVTNDKIVVRQRTPLRTEAELTFFDGHMETVESVRTPIFDQKGHVVGILGVSRDITERTKTARALRQTQRDLERAATLATQANEAKSQFLANMSHEIRTPMNAILGFSYIALQGELPENVRDAFQKIHSAANGLLCIINDILDFSKMEARKLELELTPFSLTQEVLAVLDIIHTRTMQKGIGLDACLPAENALGGPLRGDAGRLRQILLNLLGNAAKFTGKGGVLLEVELTELTEKSATLLFSIHDTGIGISREELEKLFRPFAQADGSITRRFGGTGLGLVISKELVELMGGDLQVESKAGFGSTFSFTLTFERADEVKKPAAAEPAAEENLLAGKRILLVEDNAINRMIAAELMGFWDIIVDEAEDGLEAVEKAGSTTYDAVLMDIQMPHMDGFAATQLLRRELRLHSLPIIAMTAHAMIDDRDKSLAAGMNDHITKPIQPDVLRATLLKWLAKA